MAAWASDAEAPRWLGRVVALIVVFEASVVVGASVGFVLDEEIRPEHAVGQEREGRHVVSNPSLCLDTETSKIE